MKRVVASLLISVAAAVLGACSTQETVLAPRDPALAVREARGTSTSYTVTQIALLPGHREGFAWEVNNSGQVVVQSNYWPESGLIQGHWFIRASGQNHMIGAVVRGISSGPVTYLAGSNGSEPLRWSFDPKTGVSEPTMLDLSGGGFASAVNDNGDVIGRIGYAAGGGDAAIWMIDGTRILVPNVDPSLYEGVEGRDITSAGDAVIQFHDNSGLHRGYARIASGTPVELPPLTGHVSTLVRGISEPVSGKVYVAGTSDDRNGNYRAVRWTIDRTNGAIIAREVMSDRSYSNAMADDGTIAGDLSGSANTTAFVWKLTGVTTLKTPKGSNSGRAHAISGDGKHVAGDALSGGYRIPIYWTAP
ncbi:MAG TPA: hypothetical protein VES88_07895 [Gemmatimonadaceae bacterium]|nr:hypothetical protein [Gemmatimonadaceae bacterium]